MWDVISADFGAKFRYVMPPIKLIFIINRITLIIITIDPLILLMKAILPAVGGCCCGDQCISPGKRKQSNWPARVCWTGFCCIGSILVCRSSSSNEGWMPWEFVESACS